MLVRHGFGSGGDSRFCGVLLFFFVLLTILWRQHGRGVGQSRDTVYKNQGEAVIVRRPIF